MPIVKVTSKGQATLPKALREKVGIGAPGEVMVREEEGRIIVEPVLTIAQLRARYAPALRKGPSLAAMLAEDRAAERRRERRLERAAGGAKRRSR
jgi:AbrB family looped-hinge helix DNA binding protein